MILALCMSKIPLAAKMLGRILAANGGKIGSSVFVIFLLWESAYALFPQPKIHLHNFKDWVIIQPISRQAQSQFLAPLAQSPPHLHK